MSIAKLNLTSFRNLSAVELSLLPKGINIICGQNGSGKTSLLESICAISCGKSFRTSDLNQLIQSGSQELAVYAELLLENEKQISVGISRAQNTGFKVKLSGNSAKFSELARLLPIRMISPVETNALINAGPDKRRSFLDWGVFHVKHDYWQTVKRFNKLLKQKNAALKARCSQAELIEWNKQFYQLAMKIDVARQEYFKHWQQELDQILSISEIFNELVLEYSPGWQDEGDLLQLLIALEPKERELGYCAAGPHKADLVFRQADRNNALAKEHLSRGQQKLLAISMYLAQGEYLKKSQGNYPIYLIDDFTSELDINSQNLLLKMLKPAEKQIIITALDLEHPALKSLIAEQDISLFNIESGKVEHGEYA